MKLLHFPMPPSTLLSPRQGGLQVPLGLSKYVTHIPMSLQQLSPPRGPCTIEAIFTINTLPCCGPVCTRYVHCLAQSPSHQSDRIKYWALSEMRPEENRLSLLCLRQTSPASVAQNGLTASSTPSSLPGNLDQPPTTSHGIMAWREECGEQDPSQVPGPVQLSTMGPALPLEVELPPLGLRPHCLREGR